MYPMNRYRWDRIGRKTFDKLVQAADRGVDVFFMFDHFGSPDIPDEELQVGGWLCTRMFPQKIFMQFDSFGSPGLSAPLCAPTYARQGKLCMLTCSFYLVHVYIPSFILSQRLRIAGGLTHVFNPFVRLKRIFLFRNHRKLLIVDEKVGTCFVDVLFHNTTNVILTNRKRTDGSVYVSLCTRPTSQYCMYASEHFYICWCVGTAVRRLGLRAD
jgi:phosphatidylserine/phosphatidylglycerophosphate/cardiolipin synthase-like enzyme